MVQSTAKVQAGVNQVVQSTAKVQAGVNQVVQSTAKVQAGVNQMMQSAMQTPEPELGRPSSSSSTDPTSGTTTKSKVSSGSNTNTDSTESKKEGVVKASTIPPIRNIGLKKIKKRLASRRAVTGESSSDADDALTRRRRTPLQKRQRREKIPAAHVPMEQKMIPQKAASLAVSTPTTPKALSTVQQKLPESSSSKNTEATKKDPRMIQEKDGSAMEVETPKSVSRWSPKPGPRSLVHQNIARKYLLPRLTKPIRRPLINKECPISTTSASEIPKSDRGVVIEKAAPATTTASEVKSAPTTSLLVESAIPKIAQKPLRKPLITTEMKSTTSRSVQKSSKAHIDINGKLSSSSNVNVPAPSIEVQSIAEVSPASADLNNHQQTNRKAHLKSIFSPTRKSNEVVVQQPAGVSLPVPSAQAAVDMSTTNVEVVDITVATAMIPYTEASPISTTHNEVIIHRPTTSSGILSTTQPLNEVVCSLMKSTGQTRNTVLHALYCTSGDANVALNYFKGKFPVLGTSMISFFILNTYCLCRLLES